MPDPASSARRGWDALVVRAPWAALIVWLACARLADFRSSVVILGALVLLSLAAWTTLRPAPREAQLQ